MYVGSLLFEHELNELNGFMEILTKKKQKQLMDDLIDLYTMGSDAYKSIGTHQPMSETQALKRQMRMIDAAMDAANIIRGFFGNLLLMEIDKRKAEMEERHGFPLEIK